MPGKKPDKKQEQDAKQTQAAAKQRRLHPIVTKYHSESPPRWSDRTTQFKKDWERLAKSNHYDMALLKTVMMHLIANEGPLPSEYLDHSLSGAYNDHRDCHVTGDWVLIYKLGKDSVIFVRTGTHSELFKK
jgi:mRNA interferase YafQ